MNTCIVTIVLALSILVAILIRSMIRDQRDTDFNPSLPYNTCEAIVAYHAGMNVTCGRKTNRMMSGYWVCSRHPVPASAKPKESPRDAVMVSLHSQRFVGR